jgi:glyoxylase-like metal-dependent hydrolase (beta-lactamase superfamily II)/rhodanese-related sulfurtransferase
MLKQFAAGSCYSYILSSASEALIVDPHISLPREYGEYLAKNRLVLRYIVDTHTHADHFSAAAVLKKQFTAPVLMHAKALSEVADRLVNDGDEITIGSAVLKAIYTPGHTDDAISLYGDGKLFTGDVLLIGSVGRTDFQNGSPESMYDTLQRLKVLPEATLVFPGHDYHEKRSSTIGREKANNPFLKEGSKESFAANMRSKVIPKPFNIDNIIRVNRKGEAAMLEMISPQDAHALIRKDAAAAFLDVRSVLEFSQAHIKDSINAPIDILALKAPELSKANRHYIVLCRTGNRSPMAADMLIQSGIHGVKVMDGGITRWQKEKLPVEKGAGGISIERQVRLIAGSLVLFGIIMAWLVHVGFIAIPLFVACGLIYAALTDNCLSAMLLMKLPYNRKLYKTKLGGGSCAIN